jgi:hypothetical protein
MDTKLKVLFTVCCFVAILITIFASLVASVNFKREQYNKNPYYWCDATWECCKSNNCDTTKDVKASGLDTYYPSDLFVEGSAYHQNCILPVQNSATNFAGASGSAFNLAGIYGLAGSIDSIVYGAGCTGPGGSGKCADPTYNPQVVPNCKYVSIDVATGVTGGNILPGNNSLAGSTGNAYSSSATLSTNNWIPGFATSNSSLQAVNLTTMPSWNGTNSVSNFGCPMTNPNVNKAAFATQFNNQKNTLIPTYYTN